MINKLLEMMKDKNEIYVSSLEAHSTSSMHFVAPANLEYDYECDTLEIGDDDNGVTVKNVSDYEIDYDDLHQDFRLCNGTVEILVQF